ncbi:MAG: hypothetical protein RAO94_08870 [Candidatus Stygibacter australis]|nr:hypothetical protein [Candidatus Stygibacter australis]
MNYFNKNENQNLDSNKCINSPFSYSVLSGVTGVSVQNSYNHWATTATLELNFNAASNSWAMNQAKGILGENLMHDLLGETGGWARITPAGTQQGIDGLFIKFGNGGKIIDVLVGEAKYGSSQLGQTVYSGKQMSHEWISYRLKPSSNQYSNISNKINAGKFTIVNNLPVGNEKIITIPMENFGQARVWLNGDEIKIFMDGDSVNLNYLSKHCEAISQRLLGAADQGIYRPRLFRISYRGDIHKFEICRLDKDGSIFGKPQVIQDKFDNLPEDYQIALRKHFIYIFRREGLNDIEAKVWADKCCNEPEYFNNFDKQKKWSMEYGLNSNLFMGGILAGIGGAVLDSIMQFIISGDIDTNHSIKIGALSFCSFVGGNIASVHLHWVFTRSKWGQNFATKFPWQKAGSLSICTTVSKIGGSIISAAIFAYGGYLLGLYDLKDANRLAIISSIGLTGAGLISTVSISLVANLCTASTGTAISHLSGVAATNAITAWFGGGAISAGGGGMAAGTLVLSGGTFVIVVAITAGMKIIFQIEDAKTQYNLLVGKITIVKENLNQ